jgi:hypothetical protein
MAAFGDLAGELAGRLPGLSPLLAQTFINRSYQHIRERRDWSFLTSDAAVVLPAQVTTGTASIIQGSPSVTMSAAARTALLNLPANAPAINQLQIRFMGTGQTSQIYNITQATGNPLVLILDRNVQEATNAASNYIVYRVYITPPIADFKRWISLVDMVNGFSITKGKLTYTSAYFDARDPQRQAFGLSYYCGFYKGSSQTGTQDSTPIYEMWPGGTSGQVFYCRFQRRGTDPAPNDPVPTVVDNAVIVEGALHQHAIPWCMANIGHFPAMRGADWTTLIQVSKGNYKELLQACLNTDDETALTSIWNRGHGLKNALGGVGFPYPIDSNFFQSHPVFW